MTIRECIQALEKLAAEHGDQTRVAVVRIEDDDGVIDFEVVPVARPLEADGQSYWHQPPYDHGEPGEIVIDLVGIL